MPSDNNSASLQVDMFPEEIIWETDGKMASVTLNRPSALNALSLEMIRIISGKLKGWEKDKDISFITFEGAGDRAFCSGGDVKNIYRLGMQYRRGKVGESIPTLFYAEEYLMNRQLHHYSKPMIAFMNGIVMGGGFGVAGPCDFRICSETTDFAMPEVGIGFFPDVGSLYLLQQCPGETGLYLALTGTRINAADMLYAGLATHYVPTSKQEDLKKALAAETPMGKDAIAAIIERFSEKPPETGAELSHNRETIDDCFSWDNIESITVNLKGKGLPWTEKVYRILSGRSPTSLKVTIKHFYLARGQSFDEIIARDYVLAQNFLRGHDFYEGVRAVLVDKDMAPMWDPQTMHGVTDELAEGYFSPSGKSLDEMAGV